MKHVQFRVFAEMQRSACRFILHAGARYGIPKLFEGRDTMCIFVEYEDDPGFEVGQHIRLESGSYTIIGVRDNGHGIWLTLK